MDNTKSYRLYEPGAGLGARRIVGLISRASGERMVRGKTAQAGLDWDGETLCFERIDASAARAVPTFVPAGARRGDDEGPVLERSSTAFSQPELMAIAGGNFKGGKSRTERMSEAQRVARQERIYDESLRTTGRIVKAKPEDLVERANNKQRAWERMGPALQELLVGEVAFV
jgi:hypothetical protein